MAWIKSEQNLERHPKVIRLKRLLDWNLNEVIGFLHRFWWWTLSYAEDGCLKKYSKNDLADYLETDLKTIEALYSEKWIDNDEKVHDWLEFAGKYLETKYRTSNPKKLKNIVRRYKSVLRQTKDRPKTDRLDKIDKIDKIDKKRKDVPGGIFFKLSVFLKDHILENYPKNNIKESAVESWANDFRLLVEQDNKEIEEIRLVLEWSQQDSFWKENIWSGSKFREKYDRLRAQMEKDFNFMKRVREVKKEKAKVPEGPELIKMGEEYLKERDKNVKDLFNK